MPKSPAHIASLTALVLLLGTVGASGQTHLTGDIGVDLENLRFDNSLQDTARDYRVNRSLSSHFLDLRLEGPLVSEEFAAYSVGARLFGTFDHVSADAGTEDKYIKPALPTYSAALSLFPQRSYPLRLYYNKLRDHTLRYESNNRSKIELISPELAVVRRYQSDFKNRGGMWKLAVAPDVDFTTEYKVDDAVITRRYEFGENRDIWAVFRLIIEDRVSAVHDIDVLNDIEDDTVIVFVDLDSVVSIGPGMMAEFVLDSGTYAIEFVPLHHNSYRKDIDVRGDMVWHILATPPATPNDLDQSVRTATAMLRSGGNGRFNSETYYSYSDTREAVQRMTTFLNLFSNSASYDFSRSLKMRMLTTFNQNDMTITDVTAQLSKNFLHQTSLQLQRRRGLSTSLSHSLMKASTRSDVDDLSSTTHMVSNQNTYPIERLGYIFDLKNSANLLSDNKDFVNNQYTTEVINRFDWHWRGIEWEPRGQAKYSYSLQKNPGEADHHGTEIETRGGVAATVPTLRGLGTLRVKAEHTWRRRDLGEGVDTKNRYFLDVSLTRKFGRQLKIMILTTQDKETFNGGASASPAAQGVYNPARQDQVKSLYKIDVQAVPWDDFNLGFNAMTISQKGARISRVGLSLSAKLPRVNIPVRSFILAESRDLEGLPGQNNLTLETKLSYRFRQVTLTLAHSLLREKLLTETYKFQEIRGKISRSFSVF